MSEADPLHRPDSIFAETLSFRETVLTRRSVRRFRPDPVPGALLRTILAEAQRSPSNCNTQPWVTHIVSGDVRDRLGATFDAAWTGQQFTPDFSFAQDAYQGDCTTRLKQQGATYFESMGVGRGDAVARDALLRQNFDFYGAPHAAFLFMRSVGDNVRAAADVGMYAQTLLLSLVAHGLGGIPQTAFGLFADPVRRELGVSEDFKLLFGISFGYADDDAVGASYRTDRAALEEAVVFHG